MSKSLICPGPGYAVGGPGCDLFLAPRSLIDLHPSSPTLTAGHEVSKPIDKPMIPRHHCIVDGREIHVVPDTGTTSLLACSLAAARELDVPFERSFGFVINRPAGIDKMIKQEQDVEAKGFGCTTQ